MPRWDVPSDCLRMPPRPRPRPRRPPRRPPPVNIARSIRKEKVWGQGRIGEGGEGAPGRMSFPRRARKTTTRGYCASRSGRLLARTSASAAASASPFGYDLQLGLVGGRVGSGARVKRRACGEPCAASRQRLRRGDHVASTQRSCERRHGEARFGAARMRSEMSGCCCDALVKPPRSSGAFRGARTCARAGGTASHTSFLQPLLGFVAALSRANPENWARFER